MKDETSRSQSAVDTPTPVVVGGESSRRAKRRPKVVLLVLVVLIVVPGAGVAWWFTLGGGQKKPAEQGFATTMEQADVAKATGNNALALQKYDEGIASSKDDGEKTMLTLMKVTLLLDEKKYDEALSVARDADSKWHDTNTAALLGDVYARRGEKDLARDMYHTAINRLDSKAYDYESAKAAYQIKLDGLQ